MVARKPGKRQGWSEPSIEACQEAAALLRRMSLTIHGESMEVGVFTNSGTLTLQLVADGPAQANLLVNHIQDGASDAVEIALDGTVITVTATFDREEEAVEAAEGIRAKVDEGQLLSIDIGGVTKIRRH